MLPTSLVKCTYSAWPVMVSSGGGLTGCQFLTKTTTTTTNKIKKTQQNSCFLCDVFKCSRFDKDCVSLFHCIISLCVYIIYINSSFVTCFKCSRFHKYYVTLFHCIIYIYCHFERLMKVHLFDTPRTTVLLQVID